VSGSKMRFRGHSRSLRSDTRPVKHTLPAWDLLAGAYAAFTLLAAERARRQDSQGREIRIPLSDLAIAEIGVRFDRDDADGAACGPGCRGVTYERQIDVCIPPKCRK
jgi:crotonobetainyl-CoA:carnitine CoA-transferase CaiB-like acyl-CoA transferase